MDKRIVAFMFLLMVVVFLVGWTTEHPKRWEYKQSCTESDLKDLGANGWELVSATTPGAGVTCFYFKRPN